MSIRLDLANISDQATPARLYMLRPNGAGAQPAYVSIALDGLVWAQHAVGTHEHTPEHVRCGLCTRVEVPADVNVHALRRYLEGPGLGLLARVLHGREIKTINAAKPSLVMRQVGELNEDAQSALDSLRRDIEALPRVQIVEVEEFLFGQGQDLSEHWGLDTPLTSAVAKIEQRIRALHAPEQGPAIEVRGSVWGALIGRARQTLDPHHNRQRH